MPLPAPVMKATFPPNLTLFIVFIVFIVFIGAPRVLLVCFSFSSPTITPGFQRSRESTLEGVLAETLSAR